eukprot:1746268-Karenia_brevis.AAC.1
MSCFGPTPFHRRPVLAIIGGTRTGKSVLAISVLERLARSQGLAGLFRSKSLLRRMRTSISRNSMLPSMQ